MKRRRIGERKSNEEEKDVRKDEQCRGEGWEKGILMKKRRLEERKSNNQEKDERKDDQ